jgi:hypothetical protein
MRALRQTAPVLFPNPFEVRRGDKMICKCGDAELNEDGQIIGPANGEPDANDPNLGMERGPRVISKGSHGFTRCDPNAADTPSASPLASPEPTDIPPQPDLPALWEELTASINSALEWSDWVAVPQLNDLSIYRLITDNKVNVQPDGSAFWVGRLRRARKALTEAFLDGLPKYVLASLNEWQRERKGRIAFEEAIDNVRAALGLRSTHYLVIADDVEALNQQMNEIAKLLGTPQGTPEAIVPSRAVYEAVQHLIRDCNAQRKVIDDLRAAARQRDSFEPQEAEAAQATYTSLVTRGIEAQELSARALAVIATMMDKAGTNNGRLMQDMLDVMTTRTRPLPAPNYKTPRRKKS